MNTHRIDNYKSLWYAVLMQAVKDLKETDCELKNDALLFLRNETKALKYICKANGWDYKIIRNNLMRYK